MAINFTRLATCWGKLVGALNLWNTARGATLTTRVGVLRTQFDGINVDLEDGLRSAQDSAIAGGDDWTSYLSAQTVAVLAAEVKNDRPFADTSTLGLLNELQRQMAVASESFGTANATCTTTVAAIGSPTGDPRIVASDLDAYTGAKSCYCLPDVLLVEAQGQELYAVTGNSAATGVTYPDYPAGAGLVTSVTSVDPATTSLGSDPGFDSWTDASTPTNWEVTGAVTRSSTSSDGSLYSCSFLGTGGLVKIRQLIGATPGSVVAIHFDTRKTASPANTGTLVVRLEDAAGNALSGSKTVNMSATTTSFVGYSDALWVPTTAVSGAIYLAFRFTGGIGDTVLVDRLAAIDAPELYTGGLKLLLWKGVTASVAGDAWTVTTVADGTITSSLIRGVDRLMGLAQYPVRLPTSGAPTQADALVS